MLSLFVGGGAILIYPIALSIGYGQYANAEALRTVVALLLVALFVVIFGGILYKHWRQQRAAAELLETRVQERTRDLQSALDERSVMLQEIHHRVKNNLQVIASLLHLEAAKVPDKNVERAAENSIRRIHAMSLVHETLYLTKPLHEIELGQYIRQLVTNVRGSLGGSVDIRVESSDGITVSPDFAVPFGLIVSELVTNAIKHGFPDGRAGRIEVSLATGTDISLSVSDDGVGIPADLDPDNPSNLGLRIVSSLVGQLNGKISLSPPRDRVATASAEGASAPSRPAGAERETIISGPENTSGTHWKVSVPPPGRTA